jgi:hypothetical protein
MTIMSRLRVHSFGVSIDGYGAGPNQSLDNPLGVNGPELAQWFFPTRVFQQTHGQSDGETGIDNEYLRARLIDELHLAIGPVLLGSGEPFFQGIDLRSLGYECARSVAGERATHVFIRKRE